MVSECLMFIRTLYIVNMIVASILSILILVLKCILFTMKLRLGIHLLSITRYGSYEINHNYVTV